MHTNFDWDRDDGPGTPSARERVIGWAHQGYSIADIRAMLYLKYGEKFRYGAVQGVLRRAGLLQYGKDEQEPVEPGVERDAAWPPEPASTEKELLEADNDCSTPGTDQLPDDRNARLRYLLNENARLQRENARLSDIRDDVVEVIRDAVQPIPPGPLLPPAFAPAAPRRHRPHVLMALLGDIQYGTFLRPDESGGLGYCNKEAFEERVRNWIESILTMTEIHRSAYDVPVLEVLGLGDYVEGEVVYPGQQMHIDLCEADQVFQGSKLIADALNELRVRGRFTTIRTRWLAGNHGFPAGKKGGYHPRSNWDYFFAHDVEARCSQLPIEFCISRSPFMAFRIPEAPKHIHLATHGDQIPVTMSIPYYGTDRAVRAYATLTGLPVNYFYVADKHRRASVDLPRGRWILNGNWVGGSLLSISRMMTASSATQELLVIHPERGIVAEHSLDLWDLPEMTEDRYGPGLFTPIDAPFVPIAPDDAPAPYPVPMQL